MTTPPEDDFLAIERGGLPASPTAEGQHTALADALACVGQDHDGGAWMDAVLETVDAESRPKRSRVRGIVAATVALAVTMILALALWPSVSTPPSGHVQFSMTRLDGAEVVRGRDLAPQDTVRIRWPEGQGLWLFFNETTLLLRCPGASACMTRRREAVVNVKLDKPGRYIFVLVGAGAPPPHGALEEDIVRALDAGYQATIEADVDVR